MRLSCPYCIGTMSLEDRTWYGVESIWHHGDYVPAEDVIMNIYKLYCALCGRRIFLEADELDRFMEESQNDR